MKTQAEIRLKTAIKKAWAESDSAKVRITQATARSLLFELQQLDSLNKRYFNQLEALREVLNKAK